jgi:mpaB/rubber oxygenase-like protein
VHHRAFASPVVRRVWGSPDAILLVFAGSAAEFAAIKAVDWLFFTGRLPKDPVGRFFETVGFAQRVFFGDLAEADAAISAMNRIHRNVEGARGAEIPQWAYRDVLFMLIDYAEKAHGVVFGPMSEDEKAACLEDALAVGRAMGLAGLPDVHEEYRAQRKRQLAEDYARTPLTDELYARYRTALGPLRFRLLKLVQASLVPDELLPVLGLRESGLVGLLLGLYRHLPGGGNKLRPLHGILLPRKFAGKLGEMQPSPGGPSWS